MNEEELAAVLIAHLEKQGYTCYKEVSMQGRGGNVRNDCYFVKFSDDGTVVESLAVETKTSFTLKVMNQAYLWRKHAHKVYVAVPPSKRTERKTRKFAMEVCRSMNIGVFEVGHRVNEIVSPSPSKNTITPPLYEEQRDSVAGNSTGRFYTSFQNTLRLLSLYVDENPWCGLNEAIKDIEHHYKNDTSAASSIRKYIAKGVIRDYVLLTQGKKTYINKKGD
jgi:hypothetical protein